ncbi:MAG: hypothetical protein ABSG64_10565 [Solirubrobacteraceae bacterium]|jgi:hypothetical protein
MKRARILVVVGGLGLLLMACGSSGKVSFTAQANAICTSGNAQAPPPATAAQKATLKGRGAYMSTVVGILQGEVSKLEKLKAPPAKQAAYKNLVTALAGMATAGRHYASDAQNNFTGPAEMEASALVSFESSVHTEASLLGLSQCAK